MFYAVLNISVPGFDKRAAGQKKKVGTWQNICNHLASNLPNASLRPIAFHGTPDGAGGNNTNADFVKRIRMDNQDNKRVGIGFSRTPHPLQVITFSEAKIPLQTRV